VETWHRLWRGEASRSGSRYRPANGDWCIRCLSTCVSASREEGDGMVASEPWCRERLTRTCAFKREHRWGRCVRSRCGCVRTQLSFLHDLLPQPAFVPFFIRSFHSPFYATDAPPPRPPSFRSPFLFSLGLSRNELVLPRYVSSLCRKESVMGAEPVRV
jgi:hypothetical protein